MPKIVVNPGTLVEVEVMVPGPQGPKGEDGTSIAIKGTLASSAELPAYPDNPSDAYIIVGELWVWNGSAWTNVGPFRGPPGEPGQPGAQGAPGNSGAYYQPGSGQPYVQGEGQIYIGQDFPEPAPEGSLFFRRI